MKNILLNVLIFVWISSIAYSFDGYWEARNSTTMPDVVNNFNICSIGKQKALLVEAGGNGKMDYYTSNTWLYDYVSNTWTKINCEEIPIVPLYTSPDLCQISANKVLLEFNDVAAKRESWIFDLDSVKWLQLNNSLFHLFPFYYSENNITKKIYIGNNQLLLHCSRQTWIATLDSNASIKSDKYIKWKKVNDEDSGDVGVHTDNSYDFTNNPVRLAFFNKNMPAVYVPDYIINGWEVGKKLYPCRNYNLISNEWDVLYYGNSAPTVDYRSSICNINDNNVLVFGGEYYNYTYIIHYEPLDSTTNYYKLALDSAPPIIDRPMMIKLDNEMIMVCAHKNDYIDPNYKEKIWIFHLTDTTVKNTTMLNPKTTKYEGQWTKYNTGTTPPARTHQYMCQISDNMILMTGGYDWLNDRTDDTWIYDGETNIWSEIQCETPTRVSGHDHCPRQLYNISHNRALFFNEPFYSGYFGHHPYYYDDVIVSYIWLFDLDSSQWFQLSLDNIDTAIFQTRYTYHKNIYYRYDIIQISNNSFYCNVSAYGYPPYDLNLNFFVGGWIFIFNNDEDINSPNFISTYKVEDKYAAGFLPKYWSGGRQDGSYAYDCNENIISFNKNMQTVFIPEDCYKVSPFQYFDNQNNQWNDLKIGTDYLFPTNKKVYCNLTDNVILSYGNYLDENDNNNTSFIVFSEQDSSVNIYDLKLNDYQKPTKRLYYNIAKLTDKKALLFGGMTKLDQYPILSDTWIFNITKMDIDEDENKNKEINVIPIDNNIYWAEYTNTQLYDIVGRNVSIFHTNIIDLNNFSTGTYLLVYIINNNISTSKLIKK
jgi:hypothetical protein